MLGAILAATTVPVVAAQMVAARTAADRMVAAATEVAPTVAVATVEAVARRRRKGLKSDEE